MKILDRKTRKILTMYGAFFTKSDVDRLHLPWVKCGRELISCEGFVRSEENSLGLYVKIYEEASKSLVSLSTNNV